MIPSVDRGHPSHGGGHRSRERLCPSAGGGHRSEGRGHPSHDMGTRNPMTGAPIWDEGFIHAGTWMDPCRGRVRASNLKGRAHTERATPVPLVAVRFRRRASPRRLLCAPLVQKLIRIKPRATPLPRATPSSPLILCVLCVSAAVFSSGGLAA